MARRRRKTRVGEWRKYYRFRRAQDLANQLVLLAGLVLLVTAVLSWMTGAQSPRALAEVLNTNSNLAIVLLALVTAIATVVYVHLTRSILLETVEARRADVRPFLRPVFDNPQFRLDSQREAPLLFMELAMTISNHGPGRAVGLRTHITVPYAVDESGDAKDWVSSDVKWAGAPVLEASAELVGRTSTFMPAYDLPKNGREFLELETRYEDAHQGLYCLRQYHDLFDYGASERKFMLTLRYEALYYFPYTRRKSIRDTDMGSELAWGEAPVYERRIPWSD